MAEQDKILLSVEFDSTEAEKRAAKLKGIISDLGEQRRQLNKDIKANRTEESRLTIAIQEQQQKLSGLISAGKQNTKEYEEAAQALRELKTDLDKVNKAQEDNFRNLNQVENAQKVARRELNLLNREAQSATGSLNQQRAQLAQLNRQYDQFRVGIDGTQKELKQLESSIATLTDEISQQEEATGRFQRNVGNYAGGIKDAFASAIPGGQALTAALASPAGLVAATAAGIAAGGKAIFDLQQRIEAQRKEVQLTTDATGAALDELTAKTAASADTFGQDFNQVLQATNTLTRELGGNFGENSDAIAAGLSLAGERGSELLDIVQEYPAQFRDSEISANQFIAIASQSLKEGIYSDKGIDAIKEAEIRIRELTPATRSALDAIGISSTELEERLRTGTTTIFEEIQGVSAKLSELPPQSAEVGTAIADIFGGAGEDAGLRYLTTLQNVNTSLEETVNNSSDFARQQLELQQVNADLELSFNELLGGADGVFTDLTIGAKRLVADGLQSILGLIESLINGFIELYNNSLPFRGILQVIIANVKSTFDIIGNLATGVINAFKNVGALIKAVFTGDFKAIPGIIQDAFNDTINVVKQSGKDVAENFVDAYDNTVNNKELQPFSFSSKAAEKKAFEEGKKQGEQYKKGVKQGQGDNTTTSTNTAQPAQAPQAEQDTSLRTLEAQIKVRLALVEQGTREELDLLAELEAVKRDKALQNEKLLADEKILIETEYQVKIQEIEDAKFQLILDKQTEALDIQQAELEKARANQLITEEEYTQSVLRIQIARLQGELTQLEFGSAEFINKQAEIAQKQIELREEISKSTPSPAEIFESEQLQLQLAQAKGLISEEQYTARLLAIRQKRLEAELSQLEEASNAYIQKQIELIELQNQAVEQVQAEEGPGLFPDPNGQLEQLQVVSDAFGQFANSYLANQEQMIEAEVRRGFINRGVTDASEEDIQREIELKKQQSDSYNRAKNVAKAAAISEILIARAQQIQQVSLAAAKIAATFPPPAGPILAGVYVAANVAAAVAQTRQRLAEINALQGGGFAGDGEPMTLTYKGQIVKRRRSFKAGGRVGSPTVALVGEEGAEYVAPNKQIKKYPRLFNWLDSERQGVNKPFPGFAIGGLTAKVYQPVIPAYVDGGLTANAAQNTALQNLSVQASLDLRDSLENMPAPIVTVEDINAGQSRKAQVDNSGTF